MVTRNASFRLGEPGLRGVESGRVPGCDSREFSWEGGCGCPAHDPLGPFSIHHMHAPQCHRNGQFWVSLGGGTVPTDEIPSDVPALLGCSGQMLGKLALQSRPHHLPPNSHGQKGEFSAGRSKSCRGSGTSGSAAAHLLSPGGMAEGKQAEGISA